MRVALATPVATIAPIESGAPSAAAQRPSATAPLPCHPQQPPRTILVAIPLARRHGARSAARFAVTGVEASLGFGLDNFALPPLAAFAWRSALGG